MVIVLRFYKHLHNVVVGKSLNSCLKYLIGYRQWTSGFEGYYSNIIKTKNMIDFVSL